MERGLLGLTFDPDFPAQPYVYVYYTRAAPVLNRLSRFTVSEANPDVADPASETVLLDNIPSSHYHNGGAIHFGPDGKLYVAVGDGSVPGNAQSLASLSGKMLRIDRDGGIPSDNPFFGSAAGVYRSIWALGLRNPFTFDIEAATGRLFINDVGQDTIEEIDAAETGGLNFGWPTTEGPTTNPAFRTPFYSYPHDPECAVTGGAFYDPPTANFPADAVGDYFFADFCAGWIKRIDVTTKQVSTVIAAAGEFGPVDLKVGDDGSLYYLLRAGDGNARLRRVRYVAPGVAPSFLAQPRDTTVTVGAPATFEVSASGTAPLQYQWQRDGEDIPGATSATYTLPHAALADDGAKFRAVASNGVDSATSAAATLGVTLNRPPTAVIDAPVPDARYSAGQAVPYAGHGSDPDGGTLTYTWRVDLHHETHAHPFMPATVGPAKGSFTVPTDGETSPDVWYRIHLTVTDPGGLTGAAQRDIHPRTASLRLAANVPGLTLELDGQPFPAPRDLTGVVGVRRSLAAPSPQTVGGRTYAFTGWSDGRPRSHTIATPATATTYTAAFRDVTPAAPASPLVPLALPAGPAGAAPHRPRPGAHHVGRGAAPRDPGPRPRRRGRAGAGGRPGREAPARLAQRAGGAERDAADPGPPAPRRVRAPPPRADRGVRGDARRPPDRAGPPHPPRPARLTRGPRSCRIA